MTGGDEASYDDGIAVELEGGVKADANRERDCHPDITAAATEVGGFAVHGDVAVFLEDLDWDLDGVASMAPAIGFV